MVKLRRVADETKCFFQSPDAMPQTSVTRTRKSLLQMADLSPQEILAVRGRARVGRRLSVAASNSLRMELGAQQVRERVL
jgi:hypothetical protein